MIYFKSQYIIYAVFMKKYLIFSSIVLLSLSSCTGILNKEISQEEKESSSSTMTPLENIKSLFWQSREKKEEEFMAASENQTLAIISDQADHLVWSEGRTFIQEEQKREQNKDVNMMPVSSSGNSISYMYPLVWNVANEVPWVQTWSLWESQITISWSTLTNNMLYSTSSFFQEDCYDQICVENFPQIEGIQDPFKSVSLWDLPDISQTWGKNLNPSGKVPEKGVDIIYFDITTKQILKKENRDTLKIVGIWIEQNLPSPSNLGVYAVGKINIPESGEYVFSLPSWWNSSRFMIDKKLVFEKWSEEITLYLEKWEHSIELEYICKWHVVDIILSWKKKTQIYSLSDIQKIFPSSLLEGSEIWYAGAYESGESEWKVYIDVQKSTKPVILILSSYASVEWVIQNPYKTQIQAIFYTWYDPGSIVDTQENLTTVYELDRYFFEDIIYEILPVCYDIGWDYHCEGNISQLNQLNESIERMLGKKINGFSGGYSPERLSLPQDILSEARYIEISEEQNILYESQKKATTPLDFESLFE